MNWMKQNWAWFNKVPDIAPEIKKIDVEIKDIVNDAAEFAKASPEPSVNELFTDIYLEV